MWERKIIRGANLGDTLLGAAEKEQSVWLIIFKDNCLDTGRKRSAQGSRRTGSGGIDSSELVLSSFP